MKHGTVQQEERRTCVLLLRRQLHPRNDGPGGGAFGQKVESECNAMSKIAFIFPGQGAQAELGMDTAIDHVTDFTQIAAYGVMTTPALVVDGKVVSYGKVLKKDEAKVLIQKARG